MEGRLESLSPFITAEYQAELKVNILRFSRTEQVSIESVDLVCCLLVTLDRGTKAWVAVLEKSILSVGPD